MAPPADGRGRRLFIWWRRARPREYRYPPPGGLGGRRGWGPRRCRGGCSDKPGTYRAGGYTGRGLAVLEDDGAFQRRAKGVLGDAHGHVVVGDMSAAAVRTLRHGE